MALIAHLDMDAFYVSVELLRNKALRGKAVIVSGTGPRAVVTTATYEARAFGVHSAMPTSQARRLCPAAVVVAPDFHAYRDASRRVWEIVRAEIEIVEQVGIDEGYLDLSDLIAPKAAMRRLVADIRSSTGLGASVGIGPNKLVAKVASDCEKPGGMVSLTREAACERFGACQPTLLPGIGPKTGVRLRELGLDTIERLAGADPARLSAAFGENLGLYLHRRARFESDEVLQPVRETKSQSSETTFDQDVADRSTQERVLGELSRDLCRRLRGRALRGRTVAIKVRLDDWTTVTRARTLELATNDPSAVAAVAQELLGEYSPPRPVRLLGVRVAGFESGSAPAQAPTAGQLRLAV